jgi:tetratricopeptide (TPR) repeat protein
MSGLEGDLQAGEARMSPKTPSIAQTIEFLERALCESDSPRNYAPLVEAYRLAGRLDDALRAAERGVAAFPGHVGIRIVMARVLTDLGDYERARTAYQAVLGLDPGNLEALSLAGRDAKTAESDCHRETEEPADPVATSAEQRRAQVPPAPVASVEDGTEPACGAELPNRRAFEREPAGESGPSVVSDARPRDLSEELAHLDELFVSPARRYDPGSGAEPAGIATLTLAEIYSKQGLTREAVRICETILERQPDNEEAKRALEAYLSQPASA